MKKMQGVSLIEVIIFIVIMGILATTILIPGFSVFKSVSAVHNVNVASQTATKCMEWFLGQRYINGFANITCPAQYPPSLPSICTAPSGYSMSVQTTCGNSMGDLNYTIINVSVTNNVSGSANLSLQVAKY